MSSLLADVGSPSLAQNLIADILALIFLSCLPVDPSDFDYPCISLCGGPLVYGRVCHTWRRVALSTPRLWSCFRISHSGRRIQEWIARSQAWPISFMWDFEEPTHHYHIPPIVAENVQVLLLEAHRWKLAAIQDSPLVVQQLLRPLQVHAPMLEVLDVSISDGSLDGELVGVEIQAAPVLRSVHLYEGCFDLSLSASTAQNIRDLELGCSNNSWADFASPDSSLSILANCTSLERASIAILGEWVDSPSSTLTVVAPCLQRLDVIIPSISYNFDIAPFLDKVTLPALRHLKLSIEAEESVEMPFLEIQTLISRSRASLSSLDLSRRCPPIVQPIPQLLEILELTPELEDLTLVDLNVTDTLISALTPKANISEQSSCLCHRLRTLLLVRSELSANAVISMITARWTHLKEPLRAIRLFGCNLGNSGDTEIEEFCATNMATTMGLKLMMFPKSYLMSFDAFSIPRGCGRGEE